MTKRQLRVAQKALLAAAVGRGRGSGTFTHPWMEDAGIQGFGIASKFVKGRDTGQLAFKVYVERKLPETKLPSPVPPAVELPGGQQVVTDVEAIGKLVMQSNVGRVRPATPGFGIGCRGDPGGTIGCLVQRRQNGHTSYYILSNAHVLARSGAGGVGEDLLQPCSEDGGVGPRDAVAQLTASVPLVDPGAGFPNVVDAAIAELLNRQDATAFIRRIGVPKGFSTVVRRGMQVQKTGRTTDYTVGLVDDVDFAGFLELPGPSGTGRRLEFTNQVLCTRFTDVGDSGSAVLNMKGFVVGIHVAGSARASVFCRIAPALEMLNVEIVTDEPE